MSCSRTLKKKKKKKKGNLNNPGPEFELSSPTKDTHFLLRIYIIYKSYI